jgi:hypothetical protein
VTIDIDELERLHEYVTACGEGSDEKTLYVLDCYGDEYPVVRFGLVRALLAELRDLRAFKARVETLADCPWCERSLTFVGFTVRKESPDMLGGKPRFEVVSPPGSPVTETVMHLTPEEEAGLTISGPLPPCTKPRGGG